VRKRNGQVERFDRGKLRHALSRAASKGVPDGEALDALVDEIHRSFGGGRAQVVASAEIARRVIARLGATDRICRDRFAADYTAGPDGALEKRPRASQAPAERAREQLDLFDDET
jgi:transcriptional repressor NrdR